jgi:xylulokinase
MFSLFKALWLARNEPDTWRRTARLHCFEDLLHRRLGVEPAMSWPLAGRTMLFDVRRHDWSDEILGAAGIGRAMLPRTLPAGAVVGTVPDAVARDLALAPRALVVAGGHDQTVGALGVGATEPGVAMYATGTVECICPCLGAEPRFTDDLFRSNLCTYDFTMPGHYTTVAFSLTGGNLLQWFRDEFGRSEVEEARRTGLNAYDLLLAALPPEPTRLLVLPHFTPTGTPHFDVHSTGAILGLRLTTRREEVLRALLEGVAFEMRLNMAILEQSGLPVTRLVASGGGARNLRWVQLKADVMGKPIATTATTEAGCLGAAILARAAHAGRRVEGLAREMTRETGLVAPDETRAAWYAERFELYRQLYPALRPFSRQA